MSSPLSPSLRVLHVRSDTHQTFDHSTIEELYIGFDDEHNLVFIIQTLEQKYGLIVFLSDYTNLGWQEVRAINDCIRLSQVGTLLNEERLKAHAETLQTAYGNAKGPFRPDDNDDDILMVAVYPSRGSVDTTADNTIVRTALSFEDRENAFYLGCTNDVGDTFVIRLILTGDDSQVNLKESAALMSALIVMEPGGVSSDRTFQQFIASVKANGMHVKEDRGVDHNGNGGTTYAIQVSSNEKTESKWDEYFSHTSSTNKLRQSTSGEENSPYPGIVYTKALKKSGQAQVYVGMRNEQKVAVKVFLDGADQIETYKTELRMLLKMSKHKNVVQVIDFFETPKPALVMEFIEGDDLSEHLKSYGAIEEQNGIELSVGIADGLAHMHKHGIIHRDLKSANVLRRTNGTPVIIDLGLSSMLFKKKRRPHSPTNSNGSHTSNENAIGTTGASSSNKQKISQYGKGGFSRGSRAAGNPQSPSSSGESQLQHSTTLEELCSTVLSTHISEQTKTIKGTMLWMAPEMITSHSWSDRTDVYAFGMIMWEIFTGKLPFMSDPSNKEMSPMALLIAIATGKRPDVTQISHVTLWIRDLISQCWVTDPAKRPKMMSVLHRLQRDNPKAVFDSIDQDGNGSLNFTEFVIFLDQYIPGKIPPDRMHPIFSDLSLRNGEIGLVEFKSLWKFVIKNFYT